MLESGGALKHHESSCWCTSPSSQGWGGRPPFHLLPVNHHRWFQTPGRKEIKDATWELPPLSTDSWKIFHPHAPQPRDTIPPPEASRAGTYFMSCGSMSVECHRWEALSGPCSALHWPRSFCFLIIGWVGLLEMFHLKTCKVTIWIEQPLASMLASHPPLQGSDSCHLGCSPIKMSAA